MKIGKIGLGLFFLVSSLFAMEPEIEKVKLSNDFARITLDQARLDRELLWAAKNGNIKIVEELLDDGANVNAVDEEGFSVLMKAGREGYIKIVQLLLKFGANVNAQNIGGVTALMLATFFAETEIVKILLKSGADIQITCKAGFTALALAVNNLVRLELFLKFLNQKLNEPHIPELTEFIDSDIKSALTEINLLHSWSMGVLKELHLFARGHPKEFPWLEKEINKLMNRVLVKQAAGRKEEAFARTIEYQRTLR